MVREVLTISVGQCGIQMAQTVWEQFCIEHSIGYNGQKTDKNTKNKFHCFFEETKAGRYIPRNLMIDSEPNVINSIRHCKYRTIFNPEFLVNGMEDAANIFARGYYTIGKDLIDTINDRIRKLFDKCNNLQGFFINHAIGGGTGSGLGALILERLAVEYKKKLKFGFEVLPSDCVYFLGNWHTYTYPDPDPYFSSCIVEPYNCLLSTHWLLDHTEISVLFDNKAIKEICRQCAKIRPNYIDLNHMSAQVISSMTISLRFDGELNTDLQEFQTNLVSFPRLHFMTTALAPIISYWKETKYDVQSITDLCFNPKYFFVKYNDFDIKEDKYMAICLICRGDVSSKDANYAVQRLKNNKKVALVDWCPTGFKIGLNVQPPTVLDDGNIKPTTMNAVMIGNNTAISRVFSERIGKQFDLMYAQRAYVHWFVGEGMEESEFDEAREDIAFLEEDYLDVLLDREPNIKSAAKNEANIFQNPALNQMPIFRLDIL